MGTIATMSAATLVDGARMTVFQPQDFDRMVDMALTIDDPMEGGVQRLIYAEDLKAPRPPGAMPSTVLVVTVTDDCGAAYFRRDQQAWVTHNNGQPPDAVPDLVYDDQAPSTFSSDAVINRSQLRDVLVEYIRDGHRPESVLWVPAEQYLPW